VLATESVTLYRLAASRGRAEAEALAPADGEAVIVTDRYSGYDYYPNRRRQLCWAHVKRDFQPIAQRDGESGAIGVDLLQSAEALMHWWGRYREGRLKHATLLSSIKQHVKPLVRAALERGALCDHKATRGTCRHVLQRRAALWTFLRYEGGADHEQPVRACVTPRGDPSEHHVWCAERTRGPVPGARVQRVCDLSPERHGGFPLPV